MRRLILSRKKKAHILDNGFKKVVEVIKFLAERGLAFRGDNEIHGDPSNGNFLRCIDLLAKFDSFLEEHVRRYGNPGRGKVSYLSSTTYEELIILLGSKVLEKIVTEIKEAKYYGVTVDSTPDVSHTDQLSIVIRYVSKTGDIYERFLMFVKIEKHDAKYLFDTLISVLENQGIDPKFCRCQSYDNAANMSGVYSGVQTRFREINSAATWVPCGAHSLNLVGTGGGRKLLRSSSPQRWSKLRSLGSKISVKRLSETRWSARYEAVKTLCAHYDDIRGILTNISTSEDKWADNLDIKLFDEKDHEVDYEKLITATKDYLTKTKIFAKVIHKELDKVGKDVTIDDFQLKEEARWNEFVKSIKDEDDKWADNLDIKLFDEKDHEVDYEKLITATKDYLTKTKIFAKVIHKELDKVGKDVTIDDFQLKEEAR
ncbi:uncharacterized protein LOC118184582 [Stegodyphus dumicola]|uniref:uncharacterized protein LOC118184582 n=1 Tax=Stegodyphus dumicola TaxID=202533 RepID=UPI0015B22AE3|nr:uncharacterized protein LOC118184582 [Stegodyphus dumicola]